MLACPARTRLDPDCGLKTEGTAAGDQAGTRKDCPFIARNARYDGLAGVPTHLALPGAAFQARRFFQHSSGSRLKT
jgi:hypothetical protein